MRSVLLGELDDATTSTRAMRLPRTSQASRKRFHQSLSNSHSQSKQNIQNHISYSTRSSIKTNEEVYSPFVPSLYAKHRRSVAVSPYEDFLAHLKFKAQTKSNLGALHESFIKARTSGAFEVLSMEAAFDVLNLLAEHIDSVCLHSVSSQAVSKLATSLQELYSALPSHVVEEMKESGKWEYFICRLLSFQGNFDRAASRIKKLATKPNYDFMTAYDSYLLALSRYKSLDSALKFWSEPEMRNLLPDTSKFGKLSSIDIRLKAAVENIIHWQEKRRALVSQYLLKMAVINKKTAAALIVIERMSRLGVEPFSTHVLAICKFLAAEGNISRAKELFNTVRPNEHQFYSQTKLYIYARSGDPAAALKLVEERKKSGNFQIEDRANVLLALSIAKRYDEMKDFFEASYPMSIDGFRSPKPPLEQYSICLLAHARAGNVENVEWWFMDMDRQGVKPNVQIFTHLLTLFKKIGNDRSLMYAYNQMLQSDIQPDPPLYTLMLSHFASGIIAAPQMHFIWMRSNKGLFQTRE
jgi:tetratricopeptide (TPR) repeat protein